MIDAIIKLGTTAISGAVFLIVILLVERLLLVRPLTNWLRGTKSSDTPTIISTVAIALTFGMLFENISNRIFDHVPLLFPLESDIRTEAFKGEDRLAKIPKFLDEYNTSATRLTQELKDTDDDLLTSWSKWENHEADAKDKERVALAVYYGVANKVERESQSAAGSEIRAIRDNYRFLRSIALSFLIGMFYYFAVDGWMLADNILMHQPPARSKLFVVVLAVLWVWLPMWGYAHVRDIWPTGDSPPFLNWFKNVFAIVLSTTCFFGFAFLVWRCVRLSLEGRGRHIFLTKKVPTLALLTALIVLTSVAYEAEVKSHARRMYGYGLEISRDQYDAKKEPIKSKWKSSQYDRAVADAILAEDAELWDSLRLVKTGCVLVWWTSERRANQIELGEYVPPVVLWTLDQKELYEKLGITNAANAAKIVVPDGLDEFEIRMKQLVGLPLDADKNVFVLFRAELKDIFRPASNPDPRAKVEWCAPRKAHLATALDYMGGDSIEGKAPADWFYDWFFEQCEASYDFKNGESGYPWTRLGYTFDWRLNKQDKHREFGLTELCIRPGATVKVIKKYSNRELFEKTLAKE